MIGFGGRGGRSVARPEGDVGRRYLVVYGVVGGAGSTVCGNLQERRGEESCTRSELYWCTVLQLYYFL